MLHIEVFKAYPLAENILLAALNRRSHHVNVSFGKVRDK
jgi:hypothetical protein